MWALVFLSILNMALYKMVSSHLEVTRRFRNRVLGPYLAKAAYHYARVQRKIDETPEYDTLYELGTEREMDLEGGGYVYTVIDEESKVNINRATKEILSRLPGLNEDLADEILASGLRPFSAIEEMMLVENIDEETFLKLKDFVTVDGKEWVNINTAFRETFEALGMDNYLIDIIEEYRGGPDGEIMTEDDLIFEKESTIVEDLRQYRGLSHGDVAKLNALIGEGSLKVTSSALALKIQTKVRNKPAINYTVVMENDKIKRWREE